MKCFLWHKGPWVYVYVRHVADTSYDSTGRPSYQAIRRCEACGIVVKEDYKYCGGYPTLDELNGVINVNEISPRKGK